MRTSISQLWNRLVFPLTIAFALIVAVEVIGFLLLPFGQTWLWCSLERCYP